jgi:hypothetical protein
VADLLLFPGPDGGLLALTAEELRVASLRAREVWGSHSDLAGQPSADGRAPAGPEPFLDDRGVEALTGVAASWWAAAARRGSVPHHRFGRWVRFRLSEIIGSAPRHRRSRAAGYADRPSAKTSEVPSRKPSQRAATPVLRSLRPHRLPGKKPNGA